MCGCVHPCLVDWVCPISVRLAGGACSSVRLPWNLAMEIVLLHQLLYITRAIINGNQQVAIVMGDNICSDE